MKNMTTNINRGGSLNCHSTWFRLLSLSIAMLLVGVIPMSKALLLALLIPGMLLMAWLILTQFMHLQNEKRSLTVTVIGVTVFTVIALFALIAPDGARIFVLSPH